MWKLLVSVFALFCLQAMTQDHAPLETETTRDSRTSVSPRALEVERSLRRAIEAYESATLPANYTPTRQEVRLSLMVSDFLDRLLISKEEAKPWFDSSLSASEQSLLLDNAELLADYLNAVVAVRAGVNSPEEAMQVASENIAKRWNRDREKNESRWEMKSLPENKTPLLERLFSLRKEMTTSRKPTPFAESQEIFLNDLKIEQAAQPVKEEDFFLRNKLKRRWEDVKREKPELAAKAEGITKEYDNKLRELDKFMKENVKGKSGQQVSENLWRELHGRSAELRKMEADVKVMLEAAGFGQNPINDVEKAFNRNRAEAETEGKRLEDEINRTKKILEEEAKRLEAEANRSLNKVKNLFK